MHHVGNVDFGRGITPYSSDTVLRTIYMTETIRDDYTRQLALLEGYDMTYGIYDHENGNRPMAVIGHHPAEDVVTHGRLVTKLRELVALRLPELTHTPVMELMNYPRWLLDKLIEDAQRVKVKEDQTAKEFEDKLSHPQS